MSQRANATLRTILHAQYLHKRKSFLDLDISGDLFIRILPSREHRRGEGGGGGGGQLVTAQNGGFVK